MRRPPILSLQRKCFHKLRKLMKRKEFADFRCLRSTDCRLGEKNMKALTSPSGMLATFSEALFDFREYRNRVSHLLTFPSTFVFPNNAPLGCVQ
ncbi:hypothetical protein BD410DRAFT_652769 [Rickenella mellea]|uniref:Uncharacterized protein n=1 Tax=Rickenella mellea TaxID=50990 RepID=A0A4Y7PN28_9AGAM|nr:hypothetical protein BD410DRAFT_652769 [Rickenella mellea]